MLGILGGAIMLCLWWMMFVLLFAMLAGCGYFVADNPACLYECSSHYQGAVGGPN